MNVLALLSDDSRARLERALGPGNPVAVVWDVRTIVAAVHSRKFHALVLDPALLGEQELDALCPMMESGTMPVVLYTALNPASARRVIRVAERGAHELILCGAEDEPALLSRKLQRLLEHSAPSLLLSRVAPHIAAFPPPLQAMAVGLYAKTAMPRWVGDIAEGTGFGRRTVDRWMARAGLAGAAMLLDTARLSHVWEPLVERQMTWQKAGTACGYTERRMLEAHALRLVGVQPAEFAAKLTRKRFVDRLARAVLADER